MSAECKIHGVDLHGHDLSPGGLVCPICEKEREQEQLRSRLALAVEALEEIKGLRFVGPIQPRETPSTLHMREIARTALSQLREEEGDG